MTTPARAATTLLAGAALLASLFATACNSTLKSENRVLASRAAEASPSYATPAAKPLPPTGLMDYPTDWSAKAVTRGDLAPAAADFDHDGRVTEDDIRNYLQSRGIAYTQVPQIDLNNVLRANQAATPGASPFEPPPPQVVPAQAGMAVALYPGQELLIIERPARADRYAPSAIDDIPGSGTLMTRCADPSWGNVEREVPVPLKHTEVHASIAGPISSVQVTQHFSNPYASKIEAVYVFPLPDDAAVNDFVMTIGSRSIRGVIREREQAEQIYAQAKSQGYHASLMTQERSNIFTQRVANIEPSETVDVTITYFGALGFRDSGYELVFPMVVGPRYNPPTCFASGSYPGGGIGAVPVNATGASGQATEVSYLRPQQRSGRDISISVDLNAGVRLEGIESPTHQVAIRTGSDACTAHIDLSPADSIPNRDFVLRYRVAGGQVKGGMITCRDDRTGDDYFAMVVVPPSDLSYCPRGPVELVFVVDCSGSMDGEPLALAKRCVQSALSQLRPTDTFQVIRFSDTATFMSRQPIGASPENIARAGQYVAALAAGGGTQLLTGLEPALELKGEWSRTRFVCILSDGLLGNEPEVLAEMHKRLGDSRIFTVGIGSAPNRTLMNGLARIGRGCAATVSTMSDADEAMGLFTQRVANAAMTDLRVEWGGLAARDVQPARLPDLFVGRPILITGRCSGGAAPGRTVRITGRVGTSDGRPERQSLDIPVIFASPDQSRAIPLVWARQKITELDEHAGWFSSDIGAGSTRGPNKSEITALALKHNLMSAYTSFVAVDCAQHTTGTYGTTVAVPSPMPQGVRYDTTVPGR